MRKGDHWLCSDTEIERQTGGRGGAADRRAGGSDREEVGEGEWRAADGRLDPGEAPGLLLPTGAEGCFIEGERERKRVREAR